METSNRAWESSGKRRKEKGKKSQKVELDKSGLRKPRKTFWGGSYQGGRGGGGGVVR